MLQQRRYSRTAALLSAASVLALAQAGTDAANLLVNPTFESPTDLTSTTSTTIAGWSRNGPAQRAVFQNLTPGGRWAIWSRTFEPAGNIFQNVSGIQAGTQYTFSANMFFEANFNTTSATVFGTVDWRNASNASVGTNGFSVASASNPTTDAWTPFSITPTAPATATQALISFGWQDGGGAGPQLSQFFDDVVFDGAGTVVGSNWLTNGSGDWNVADNWANIVVPNAVGAEANLLGAITSNQTIFSNTGVTVGTINFNNANSYVIAGAGSLTLQNTGANSAGVNVQSGSQKINLPLTVASNTTLNVSGGATLRISDPVTINAGRTVSQTGAGAVLYESTVNVLTGGGFQMRSSSHMAGLTLGASSTATLLLGGGNATAQKIDALSLNATSTFDLNDNDLVTGAGKSTVENLVRTARNNGAWNMPGITSSTARNNAQGNTGLAVVSGAEYASVGGGATFSGRSYAPSDTLVKYTWNGDANVNGVVNFDDYVRIDVGFNTNLTGWVNGDFNYSGQVNFDDYVLIDVAFNTQSGTLGRAVNYLTGEDRGANGMGEPSLQEVAEHFGEFGAPYASAFLAAVPEPAALGLLGVPALAGMARRNRRRSRA